MKHLTLAQRYALNAYLQCGKTKNEIAILLNVHRSTVYRELKRNSRKRGSYNPDFANELAQERKERLCRHRKFDYNKRKLIDRWLTEEQWSPEQIKGYCDKEGIDMVSHERIYQYIRKDKVQGGTLYKHLRHKLKHRKRPILGKQQVIKNKVSIEKRPYKNSVKSITSDNGSEFAKHEKIAKKLKTKFYFAHPYSSWERGLSEYSNKLIRQYIPKQSNFNNFDDKFITKVQHKINRRPRKNLEFKNPKQMFFNAVAFET